MRFVLMALLPAVCCCCLLLTAAANCYFLLLLLVAACYYLLLLQLQVVTTCYCTANSWVLNCYVYNNRLHIVALEVSNFNTLKYNAICSLIL